MGSGQSTSQEPPPEELHLSQNQKKIEDIAHVLDVKARSENPLLLQEDNWDQHEQDKENVRLLKGLFKTLDPSVVRIPGDVYGQVQLSFKYDAKRQLLLVKVVQCRDLCCRDVRTRALAPYIKLQMFPDTHSHGAKTTQIITETRKPVFNEIFAFRASEEEMKETRLVAQMWDYDVASRDDFLGEVIVDTKSFNFQEEPVITAWFDLRMETDLSVTGELSVTVNFQMPSTLLVTVHGARGLSPRSGNQSADPFIKLAIPGAGAVYSSQIQKNTLDPEWEETFEFDVAVEELSLRYVVFHIVDQTNILSENHSMGQAILDLHMMETQPTFHDTLQLADLKNTERMQNKLTQQVVTQEFREACLAHTMSRRPDFLFQQHRGSKMVRVSCRKAGRTSSIGGQLRIMEGVPVF
ncbi:synaptotagmin-1-like [Littorina saxatilis]|uniref:C2 domain-containing protein n=1 Tax=Littorina saxatilis TaxID=31220 RepID=A0AAN9BBD9_9CAEN